MEEVEDLAINECIILDLYPPDVCYGMVKLAGVSIMKLLVHIQHENNLWDVRDKS